MPGFASSRAEHISLSPRGGKLRGSPRQPTQPVLSQPLLWPAGRCPQSRTVSPKPDRVRTARRIRVPPRGAGDAAPSPRYLRLPRPGRGPAALPAFRNRAQAPANHFPDPDALIELPRLPDGQPGRVFQATPGAGGFLGVPACYSADPRQQPRIAAAIGRLKTF